MTHRFLFWYRFSHGPAWFEVGLGLVWLGLATGAFHAIIAFSSGSAWLRVGLGLVWLGLAAGAFHGIIVFPTDLLGLWLVWLGWSLVWLGLAAGAFHEIIAFSNGSAWFGIGLGLVWLQARFMESLCFPIDLLGLGLLTSIAMRAMSTAPSGGHARRLLATTGLLHEAAVRRNPSQADQPARSCLLTPLST